MVGLVVNIEIREADLFFPTLSPFARSLSLLPPLLNIFVNWNWNQAGLSSAHYQITRTNFPNLTWLEAGVLDINEFGNYSFSVKQQIARWQFCQAWRIFIRLPNFPTKNFIPICRPEIRLTFLSVKFPNFCQIADSLLSVWPGLKTSCSTFLPAETTNWCWPSPPLYLVHYLLETWNNFSPLLFSQPTMKGPCLPPMTF